MSYSLPSSHNIQPSNRVRIAPALGDAVHYYGWLVSRIGRYVGKDVLDIGSGFGTYLQHIIPLVDKITSVNLSPENVEELNQKYRHFNQFRAVCANFNQTPLPVWMKSSNFDTILCLNVLQKFDDDLFALRHMNAILPLGEGILILQIPSHPWLYGTLDKRAGHYRRYTKAEIATKLEQTGFKVLHIEYFNRLSALFWWSNGRLFKRRWSSRIINFEIRLFDRILVPILKPLEWIFPIPFGQSLLISAVKQREDY